MHSPSPRSHIPAHPLPSWLVPATALRTSDQPLHCRSQNTPSPDRGCSSRPCRQNAQSPPRSWPCSQRVVLRATATAHSVPSALLLASPIRPCAVPLDRKSTRLNSSHQII